MPIYEYEREDGVRIEVRQDVSDDPLQTDPETGQKLRRVFSAPGTIYRTGHEAFAYRSTPKDRKIL